MAVARLFTPNIKFLKYICIKIKIPYIKYYAKNINTYKKPKFGM